MAAKIITFTADRLKHLGGSQSDDWNVRLANDTAQALWLTNSDDKACDQQVSAALAGLSGIALLAHTTPLSWEHIGLSGDFLWDRAAATAEKRRPLNFGRPRIAA